MHFGPNKSAPHTTSKNIPIFSVYIDPKPLSRGFLFQGVKNVLLAGRKLKAEGIVISQKNNIMENNFSTFLTTFFYSIYVKTKTRTQRRAATREVNIMLDKLFDELRDEGFIYDTDENGLCMSYGEYAAVNQAFEEALLEEVQSYTDFESAADALKDLMDCSDDVRCFFYTEQYEDFDYSIEDDGTIDMWNVPETLKDLFEELKERYDDEHRIEEDEEEYEDWDMDIA